MNSDEAERLAKMEQKQDDLCNNMDRGFERLDKSVASIETKIDNLGARFVTRHEFLPIKSIVYGMVGAIMLAVLGAILSFVIGA